MRFAIATNDRYRCVFEEFAGAGWTPVKLFTSPSQCELDANESTIELANQHRAPIQLSRMTDSDLAGLHDAGCDILIVAGYKWRVPDWSRHIGYAINFHPSPLPEGRGPYPVVRAILDQHKSWAVTCHRISPRFDEGAILAAQPVLIDPQEDHESLYLKIQIATRRLAAGIAENFMALWDNAQPQTGGTYYPAPTPQDRIIDFTKPVDEILRHVRAYGKSESLARVDGTWLLIKRAVGWKEKHPHSPGKVVHVYNKNILLTTLDGYVGLQDIELAPPRLATLLDTSH